MKNELSKKESKEEWRLFDAEAAYAESIFSQAIGDVEASIVAAERALEIKPYPPAVLTMGSIEYQCGRPDKGAHLFSTLLSLPDEDKDLWEIIDKAGDFLIQEKRYEEGLGIVSSCC